MRILITGSNGLLGQKIVRQLVKNKIEFCATSLGENRNSNCPSAHYQQLDITEQAGIDRVVNLFKPTVIVNTAAMTNVDACEAHQEQCEKINVSAVKLLFEKAKSTNIHFIQLSTDFVFDGENGPYREEDERKPLSIYAKSKVDAENLLIDDSFHNWSILRTIIVFGEGENLSRSNIVLWAKSVLEKGETLSIVDDQFRAPTWADDLAWACIETTKRKAYGIFHIAGPETFSIYELVKKVSIFFKHDFSAITAVSSSTLNQKAKRPPHTGFILDKARNVLNYNPMAFEESLARLKE